MTEGFRFLAWHDSRNLPLQLCGPLAILQPLQDSVHSSFSTKAVALLFLAVFILLCTLFDQVCGRLLPCGRKVRVLIYLHFTFLTL